MHKNRSGLTALTQLLLRAHVLCGCLKKLITRIPLCQSILPDNSLTNNLDCKNGTQLLMSLSDLLNSIRTCDISRILNVLELWIELNLLIITGAFYCQHFSDFRKFLTIHVKLFFIITKKFKRFKCITVVCTSKSI